MFEVHPCGRGMQQLGRPFIADLRACPATVWQAARVIGRTEPYSVLQSSPLRGPPLSVSAMPALSEISNENESASRDPPAKIQKVDVISTLQVKLLSDKATVPRRGSAKAAGYDLARFAQ